MDASPIHLERAAADRSGPTTLPQDVARDQWLRVQFFLLAGALLWAITLAMDATVAPHGDRGPYLLWFELGGLLLTAGSALFVRAGGGASRWRVDLAIATVPLHGLLLGLLQSWAPQPTNARPLSAIVVLVLFFGLLAPTRPRTLLIVGLLASVMDPIAVWIAHLRGLPVPDPLTAVLLFYPNYVCAILAVAPSTILYRLGREIRAARALGSYQLIERIGEGGMGEVWVARHRLLARQAAIKLVRRDRLGDANGQAVTLARFEREAQATAALTSPHTIRVFDFGVADDGTFYYVMELLDGRDLESLVAAFGPLAPRRVVHLLRQICRSLAEAHANGLIHRDIKPANVFLCRMGLDHDVVKVLDFGLVRHEDRSTAPTWATSAVTYGTPAYMAPEAILGENDVDRRADVYAIGCVAYYMLTGHRVFAGPTPMKLMMQHVNDRPVPPSQRVGQAISPALEALVLSCLHKDPRARPADAGALLQLVNACAVDGDWDEDTARVWWERHLPATGLARRRVEQRAS
jgi:eukaryotic-like serine/threonine-protein kinase